MSNFVSTNPADGKILEKFPRASDSDIEDTLAHSRSAYLRWRTVAPRDRADVLRRTAELHRARRTELASIATSEMGKPISQAEGEVDLVASIYEYYADHGPEFLADEELDTATGGHALVRTEPIGPLIGIMPWNFPYYQVARFAAPNIVLGNTVLLKHASNCPRAALAIERLFAEAGLPHGVYLNVFADNEQVATMIADSRVQGVSLTGSERAGSAVGEVAGRHMKKYVLELGGSDPFIVLDADDVTATATAAAGNRMRNAGQTCIASKRFIVLEDLYEEFLGAFVPAMQAYRPDDPADPATRLGPLSSPQVVDDLEAQVQDAAAKGATVLTGGRRVDGPGAYYEPTVLTEVTPEMRAHTEELFGPVAVVYKVRSAEEAVSLANSSPFGLGGAIYSSDVPRARELAAQLEAGMVWINGPSRSAPDLPFGGVKHSGVGRELGKYGINEFANKKLIHIAL